MNAFADRFHIMYIIQWPIEQPTDIMYEPFNFGLHSPVTELHST